MATKGPPPTYTETCTHCLAIIPVRDVINIDAEHNRCPEVWRGLQGAGVGEVAAAAGDLVTPPLYREVVYGLTSLLPGPTWKSTTGSHP
ncbi:hypothetical protein [Edaphobacter aggregans]|uniref:hypothetical protein n=1 Tax=Edaphobacter aggregans TaxID=570835 RepID=UPI0012F8835A|nr:hypothetical protein [Edaphobacter aggregans]